MEQDIVAGLGTTEMLSQKLKETNGNDQLLSVTAQLGLVLFHQ